MNTIDITNIVCEFLEVAVHIILHARRLYPEAIFVPRKKYNIVVQQSEHPLLNEYITQCLKAACMHMNNNQLKQFMICIKKNAQVVEKYVFDILQFQCKSVNSDVLLVKLEQELRNFCLKLTTAIGNFELLGSNLEFDIILHTTEYSALNFNEEQSNNDFPWINVKADDFESIGIIPMCTIDSDNIVLQGYIEKNWEIS